MSIGWPRRDASVSESSSTGSAVLAFVLWLAVAAVVLLMLAAVAERTLLRGQAQTAADAAALAGAAGGREAASEMATANGGQLVAFEIVSLDFGPVRVEVRVEVGGVVAKAAAEQQLVGRVPSKDR